MSDIHYYSNYSETRDIDCFFRIEGRAYHFASNGYPIPWFITREKNLAIQDAVYERLPNVNGEANVHRDTICSLILEELGNVEEEAYVRFDERNNVGEMIDGFASSFKEMAQFGFVSMDLDEDGLFHIIATPKDQTIPREIMDMLPVVNREDVRIDE